MARYDAIVPSRSLLSRVVTDEDRKAEVERIVRERYDIAPDVEMQVEFGQDIYHYTVHIRHPIRSITLTLVDASLAGEEEGDG